MQHFIYRDIQPNTDALCGIDIVSAEIYIAVAVIQDRDRVAPIHLVELRLRLEKDRRGHSLFPENRDILRKVCTPPAGGKIVEGNMDRPLQRTGWLFLRDLKQLFHRLGDEHLGKSVE